MYKYPDGYVGVWWSTFIEIKGTPKGIHTTEIEAKKMARELYYQTVIDVVTTEYNPDNEERCLNRR